MAIEIRAMAQQDLAQFLLPAQIALGFPPHPERIEQVKTLPELSVRYSAFDGDQAVAAAGVYDFSMTVSSGRTLPIAGLTMVGVLPTHRRRGVLTALMTSHFEEARRRGQSIMALFASEGPIYQRFGYGIASMCAQIEIAREHTAFQPDAPKPATRARLVSEEEALATFPAIWDRVRLRTPGMLSRSQKWWQIRRVSDPPWVRLGRAPMQRVLIEVDGQPAAYAIYRLLEFGWDSFNINTMHAEVTEAVGDGVAATAAVWRYLLDLDLVRHIKATLMPVDHPLRFLMVDQRRLRMCVTDALWVRILDVEAALSARAYNAGTPLVLRIRDARCPWNEGCFRLQDGVARRTPDAPDLELSIDALGSLYLGAFRFAQLAAAGRVTELKAGALHLADTLFASAQAPWAPEIF
jgi:predicted acetyltransferase